MTEDELREANKPVTKGVFEKVVQGVARHILKTTGARSAELQARIEALGVASTALEEVATMLVSAERRLSRHSTHLAGIEDRLKKLERK